MTPDVSQPTTIKQRIIIACALCVGALITFGVALSLKPDGPGSKALWDAHTQTVVPKTWLATSSLDALSTHVQSALEGRALFALDKATLVGGYVMRQSPLWLHLRWKQNNKNVSMFLKPIDHQIVQEWSCRPLSQGTICQRTRQGWHVALVSNTP